MNLRATIVRDRRGVLSVAILGALTVGVTSDVARTHTHKSPDGTAVSWYPHECCHDGDCRPVSRIVRAPQGLWVTTVDNQTVLDRSRRPPFAVARYALARVHQPRHRGGARHNPMRV